MTDRVCDMKCADAPENPAGAEERKPVQGTLALPSSPPSSGRSQIALPFSHQPVLDEAGFVPARSNAAARAWLFGQRTIEGWPDRRLLLWGGPGRGKTHLLRVWAARHEAKVIEARALDVDVVKNLAAGDGPGALAIDDLSDDAVDEVALLQALNLARELGAPVLMTARQAPARWRLTVPDLQSRVRATMAVSLGPAEDVLLRRLMLRLLAERQLVVAASVVEWMLPRLPREARAVQLAVQRIDAASLSTGAAFDRAAASALIEELLENYSG
ncbi:chromosome replication initiator DnaA [Acetobacter nitrogenifigens DSM 23921 = NBRC 105050]|nr:chromosome replication initiator DnaA [Acetobacter nitrogenifigens DSM 23921 = NBRC 105050]